MIPNVKEDIIQIKSNSDFKNIKSDYFLQKLFDYLRKNKSLVIVKYNKNIQKRLNININDYKLCSGIEIEIIPSKEQYEYNRIINYKEEEKAFYHIYFNDSIKEINNNSLNKEDKISKIKIIIDYQVKSFDYLFYGCINMESIFFKKFYRNNITNMHSMFYACNTLKELNLSNFNSDNVTDMGYMFFASSSLKELNLSSFDTKNVVKMDSMFSQCTSLEKINISNFNTNNVTNMEFMFSICTSLKEIDISNFNTNNVKNMFSMFDRCSSLKELNFSNFNTNNVTNMKYMFGGCSEQLKIKIKSQYKIFSDDAF